MATREEIILNRKELTEKLRILEKEVRDIKYFVLDRIEIELSRVKEDLNKAII